MVRRCCFDTVGVFDQSLLNIDDWDMRIRTLLLVIVLQ